MSNNIPNNLLYTKSHEWIRIEGETAFVGITDHAQHELTDVVFVEVPAVGRKLKSGETCAVVESVKTASDIYSPVSGEVVQSNETLASNPGLVNTDPYGEGWFFKIKISSPDELKGLMKPADYAGHIKG